MLIDIQIPDWARWVAQNADGEWVAFRKKPEPIPIYNEWITIGAKFKYLADGIPSADWTKTLKRVER